jgi:hypothetical protein
MNALAKMCVVWVHLIGGHGEGPEDASTRWVQLVATECQEAAEIAAAMNARQYGDDFYCKPKGWLPEGPTL